VVPANSPTSRIQSTPAPTGARKPRSRPDKATIEIYFEAPKQGKPGAAFAFRGIVNTKDGWDYVRDTAAFAVNWRETYAHGEPTLAPDDCR
jgi:hypothetical protein